RAQVNPCLRCGVGRSAVQRLPGTHHPHLNAVALERHLVARLLERRHEPPQEGQPRAGRGYHARRWRIAVLSRPAGFAHPQTTVQKRKSRQNLRFRWRLVSGGGTIIARCGRITGSAIGGESWKGRCSGHLRDFASLPKGRSSTLGGWTTARSTWRSSPAP